MRVAIALVSVFVTQLTPYLWHPRSPSGKSRQLTLCFERQQGFTATSGTPIITLRSYH